MEQERRELVETAKIYEESERWGDMVNCMKAVITMGGELNPMERKLLSVSYRYCVGARRSAWRAIAGIEQKPNDSAGIPVKRMKEIAKQCRLKVEQELIEICTEIITLLDDYLLNTIDTESQVFYLKMKGDYHRYLSEFTMEDRCDEEHEQEAKKAYGSALNIAKVDLHSAHPVRLGLVLNYSVFNFEILQDLSYACELAREGIDEAANELETLSEDLNQDSTLIIQLLRDNLTLWKVELEKSRIESGY